MLVTKKEKTDKEFEDTAEVLKEAFSIFFYEAYIGFRINPERIEESELTKKAFEYARDGSLKRIRKAFPGKSEEEYQKMLDKCCRHEILCALKEDDAKLKSFGYSTEKLIKMAEMLPPLSEVNKT